MENIEIMTPQQVLTAIKEYKESNRALKYTTATYTLLDSETYLDFHIQYDNKDYYISDINVAAIFIFQTLEIDEDKQNLVKDRFSQGYDAGYTDAKHRITERIANINNGKDKLIVLRGAYKDIFQKQNYKLSYCQLRNYYSIGRREGKLFALRECITDIERIFKPKREQDENLSYQYDASSVNDIFNFCIETNVFKNITPHDFGRYIAHADFSEIYDREDTIQSKLKYAISVLQLYIDPAHHKDWYREAAQSICQTPSKCSGANVSDDWKYNIDKFKKKKLH